MTAFDRAWDVVKMPFQYHLTDNPNFALDPDYEPEDNAFAIFDRSGHKGIYTSPKNKVETWLNAEGYWRPYVAELEMDDATLEGTEGRWNRERFIPASSFDNVSVRRVMPLDILAREEYGTHGWIAGEVGRTFEGDEIDSSHEDRPRTWADLYPFNYVGNERVKDLHDFSGIDTRQMTQEQIDRIQNDFDEFMRIRGYDE